MFHAARSAFALSVFVFAPLVASAQLVDPTTGRPLDGSATPPLETAGGGGSASSQSQGYVVLWDLTHGVFLDYEPAQAYSELVTHLGELGFTVATTTTGVDNENLADYDVLVVNVGSARNSAYTAPEVSAIEAFVADGGGLLVFGDNSNVWPDNVNPVLEPYGIDVGTRDIAPNDLPVTDWTAHPVFAGLEQLRFVAAGELSVQNPGVAEAFSSSGEELVASVPGSRVLAVGDINFLTNDDRGVDDNIGFEANAFRWLAGVDLIYTSLPDVALDGDDIRFVARGGGVGQRAFLYSLTVNGAPLFLRLHKGTFDANGEYRLDTTVPSGIAGIDLVTMVLGFDDLGDVLLSEPETTLFR